MLARVALRLGMHWRVDGGGRIAEGWTIADLPDAFDQMGVDLVARALALGRGRPPVEALSAPRARKKKKVHGAQLGCVCVCGGLHSKAQLRVSENFSPPVADDWIAFAKIRKSWVTI